MIILDSMIGISIRHVLRPPLWPAINNQSHSYHTSNFSSLILKQSWPSRSNKLYLTLFFLAQRSRGVCYCRTDSSSQRIDIERTGQFQTCRDKICQMGSHTTCNVCLVWEPSLENTKLLKFITLNLWTLLGLSSKLVSVTLSLPEMLKTGIKNQNFLPIILFYKSIIRNSFRLYYLLQSKATIHGLNRTRSL